MRPFKRRPAEVRRLRLEEGDTLVLRVDSTAPTARIIELTEQMEEAFPNHPSVVLTDDLTLEVVGAPATPKGEQATK